MESKYSTCGAIYEESGDFASETCADEFSDYKNYAPHQIQEYKNEEFEKYLTSLRNQNVGYQCGLQQAIQFVKSNNGTVEHLEDGIILLTLNRFEVYCFQPYEDIDRFYYEC